ncbi:DUF6879 family protein [Nocardia sp. NPDC056564]|uniref:DUF6879 family protein n=1 Tax=Nocardia sp. NPDC056564 TaxID=3345865 RepID=UPI003672874A
MKGRSTVQLVGDDGFRDLLRSCKREAFHLEVLDSYAEPHEHEPLRRFLDGEPDDYAWFRPWMNIVQETTDRGVAVTRTRIVSVPHTDYTRFSLAVAELNIQAGEDIRYLPRHVAEDVPPDDFWLFDDELVIFSAFGPSRAWSGAVTVDATIAGYCHRMKEQFWALSVPYSEYITA